MEVYIQQGDTSFLLFLKFNNQVRWAHCTICSPKLLPSLTSFVFPLYLKSIPWFLAFRCIRITLKTSYIKDCQPYSQRFWFSKICFSTDCQVVLAWGPSFEKHNSKALLEPFLESQSSWLVPSSSLDLGLNPSWPKQKDHDTGISLILL